MDWKISVDMDRQTFDKAHIDVSSKQTVSRHTPQWLTSLWVLEKHLLLPWSSIPSWPEWSTAWQSPWCCASTLFPRQRPASGDRSRWTDKHQSILSCSLARTTATTLLPTQYLWIRKHTAWHPMRGEGLFSLRCHSTITDMDAVLKSAAICYRHEQRIGILWLLSTKSGHLPSLWTRFARLASGTTWWYPKRCSFTTQSQVYKAARYIKPDPEWSYLIQSVFLTEFYALFPAIVSFEEIRSDSSELY